MNSKDYLIAKKFREKLSNVVSGVNLIVFGSRARENHNEYSDMDVFVEAASLV